MKKTYPQHREKRTASVFLLFPKTLRLPNQEDGRLGRYETRWLERAKIEQTYVEPIDSWVDHGWAD